MDTQALQSLSVEEKLELLELLTIRDRRHRENMLEAYKPYVKQKEFHEVGKDFRERLFMAGNQLGKTMAGAYEIAMHATGRYPDWWKGRRFHRPVSVLVGSESGELTRKGVQRLLVGPPQKREEWGTGAIPKECIGTHSMKQGVPDALASITVKNEYGGESVIQFNSYDQGRMQRVDSLVLTPAGWRQIGALKPGDEVIAGDGSVTVVEGVFPHGVKDLYELTFDSGIKTLAGAEHLWQVGERTAGAWKVVTTADLIERYGDAGERVLSNKQVSTPNVGVVQFPARPVPLDPYLVGALLGDGCVRAQRIRFTSTDEDILGHVAAGAAEVGADLAKWGEIQFGFSNSQVLKKHIEDLGMAETLAHEKAVPELYLWNSPDVRFAVLQGLLDTDGSVSKKGTISFASTSPALADGVTFLVRSLGGKVRCRVTASGRKRPLHVLSISLPGPAPFRLQRKIDRCVRPACETHRHILRSIRKIEPAEAVCIAVAHESHLYVTDDFIVTHNTKWQADTVDLVWMDEEPPLDIYSEALTRTNATGGIVFVTFTPLMGMSQVVKRFLLEKPEGTTVTRMTIEDAEHYTEEEKARIIATYPEHEREARARGIPIMGSGLVFPVAESAITVQPFEIPPHWARINGVDFGWGHPSAFACIAHDRDTDTAYVYDAWKLKETPVMTQAGMVIGKGYQNIPWEWPHDGLQHDKGSGEILMEQYKKFGMNMLSERAQFEPRPDGKPGGNSVEAGVSMMMERMQTRRLRVFSHLEDWFSEFRLYHRKEGIIVKEDDDILSATRYALMMLRKAKSLHELEPVKNQNRLFAANVPRFEVFDPAVGW
jgi:phage terminase large subunit-like protein